MKLRSGRGPELLFSKYDVFRLAEGRKRDLHAHIARMTSDEIAAKNADELSTELARSFGLCTPTLADRDKIEVIEREIQIDISRDTRFASFERGPHYVSGIAYDAQIPFEGSPEFFHVRASQFTSNPPQGRVDVRHLVFTVQGTELKGEQVNSCIERFLKDVTQHLDFLATDFQKLGVELPAIAHQAIEERRAQLAKRDSVRDEIGFNVRKSS